MHMSGTNSNVHMRSCTRKQFERAACLLVSLGATVCLAADLCKELRGLADEPFKERSALSPYMNSVPPSKDYFCVGTGLSNRVLHPDRAPHTNLAMQGPVVLFSGAAPQQGLNFQLSAGSLIYRNQMSTLGSPEPPPQVGTAGMLKQQPWEFVLPWSEARWHPGEDVTWSGYRRDNATLFGLPHWNFKEGSPATNVYGANWAGGDIFEPVLDQGSNGGRWMLRSSFNLQLARGIYQANAVRTGIWGAIRADSFREPWFQALGSNPAYNASFESFPTMTEFIEDGRLAKRSYPNYFNIYPFTRLELEGNRLVVDFERSATWPRSQDNEIAGAVVAAKVADEYGNLVHFDRVPKYGWETDYKLPRVSGAYVTNPTQGSFSSTDPQAWRLPHKRLRTVRLIPAENAPADLEDPSALAEADATWTVAFVYEHPESDRIQVHDTPHCWAANECAVPDYEPEDNAWKSQWKSIYSHLPQADWEAGRLPELNDQTTLLTVQVYRGNPVVDGAAFQDDYSVWGSTIGQSSVASKARVNKGIEFEDDRNGDDCPGICGIDDDGDGLIDEGGDARDDNEDGVFEWYGPGAGSNFVCVGGANALADCGKCVGGSHNGDSCNYSIECSGGECAPIPNICQTALGTCSNSEEESCDGNSDCPPRPNVCNNVDQCCGQAGCSACPDGGICGGAGTCNFGQCVATGNAGPSILRGRLNNPEVRASDPPGDSNSDGRAGDDNVDEDGDSKESESSDGSDDPTEREKDPFYVFDDDEDGIYDEDGDDDPLLVHLRALDGECASGLHPFVPPSVPSSGNPARWQAVMPGNSTWDDACRTVAEASKDDDGQAADPWIHQVQYVYARSNPHWLLAARNTDVNPAHAAHGTMRYLQQPQYYYFPPFDPDLNNDGNEDLTLFDRPSTDIACSPENPSATNCDIKESSLVRSATPGEFHGMVVDSSAPGDNDNLPNVHPDCVPDRNFRGPQGFNCSAVANSAAAENYDPAAPGDIHLIKRIVRTRPDQQNPTNIVEQTWLYRYNDAGFLKAVFDPASVQALLEAVPADGEPNLKYPDDILKYSDTQPIAGRPLITYAAQWFTYYQPYPFNRDNQAEVPGIPPCFDRAPWIGPNTCGELENNGGPDIYNPMHYLASNVCDGFPPWSNAYGPEMHVDSDCSEFLSQTCGQCMFRGLCSDNPCIGNGACACPAETSESDTPLAQLGITGAVPRFRQYLIKTARYRDPAGEFRTYRFDYLGAPGSVYDDSGRITSYADPHNITIVDELVEQSACERDTASDDCSAQDQRSQFYIYEDDFRFVVDPSPARVAAGGSAGGIPFDGLSGQWLATSHYMYVPVKVKTRRVVTMNYYGIAISDRLILTPGFHGDQTQLVDDRQYELINRRGQVKHLYDQSWVAGLREYGNDYIKDAGRVLVELFGGEGGWHSVLRGFAWGSGGGLLYDQQCIDSADPESADDVPIRRVKPEHLIVTSGVKHVERGDGGPEDLPGVEVSYSKLIAYDDGFNINDPANTLGTQVNCNPVGEPCALDANGECPARCIEQAGVCREFLVGSPDPNPQDQDSVTVNTLPYDNGLSGDGATAVRYAYEFDDTDISIVRWKWRWDEAVPSDRGGSGLVSAQVWYFDQNGQIRLVGRGSATPNGTDAPTPHRPFVYTYIGYDEFGRPAIQVENCDDSIANIIDESDESKGAIIAALSNVGQDSAAPFNLITFNEYDDSGALKSTRAGFVSSMTADWKTDGSWSDLVRTDYKTIAHRTITYTEENDDKTNTAWTDPYIYQLEYQNVRSGDNGDEVHGTTTVRVLDRGGRFVEERVIARRGPEAEKSPIDDFGWAITLLDYDHDLAIDDWGNDNIPRDLWGDPSAQSQGSGDPDLLPGLDPEYPGITSTNPEGEWPPDESEQIVTLSRRYNLYTQASSLKPTHDVIFHRFDIEGSSDIATDPRAVVREYTYDLEDRVARSKDPDGSISRFLFDARRRPTKIFKGSSDSCPDWWPAAPGSTADDDMLLLEHRLYNDGFACREFNPLPGEEQTENFDPCGGQAVGENENFPHNAGQLVRTRRFSGQAEFCGQQAGGGNQGAYQLNTPSRDTRLLYDKRGRAVIVLEGAVGYASASSSTPAPFENPKFISATSTVYDGQDRPILVAGWRHNNVPDVETVETWADAFDGNYAMQATVSQILALGPITLSHTLYDDRGRPYEQRTYNVDEEDGGTYEFTRTWRDDLDRVIGELTPTGFTVNQHDALGRVIATCWWSKQPWSDPAQFKCEDADAPTESGNPVELTATQTDYDAFGNVLVSIHYDRLDTQDITEPRITEKFSRDANGRLNLAGMDAAGSNAIVTYTCNWYDAAKRLAATAYFGTNSTATEPNNSGPDSLFENGPAPQYSADNPPIWTCEGSGENQVCNYKLSNETTPALVNRYGFDAAGRRIWSQDSRGIVTRTWHDLLGRTLLVAENWKDFPGNSGPDQSGGGGGGSSGTSNLTHAHSGPIRYTAYHHTRGGLLDMIVAIEPDVPDANITPYETTGSAFVDWDENAENDWRAISVEVIGADVQATQLVYHLDPADGSPIANIVAEVTAPGASPGEAFASYPNLVSEIRYPLADTGQPDPEEDVVRITYTPGGQIASRTDQRDVTLQYQYGTIGAYDGSDQLSAMRAVVPSSAPSYIWNPINWLQIERVGGLIVSAQHKYLPSSQFQTNGITWEYNGFNNLESETISFGYGDYPRTVGYSWTETGVNQNRLNHIDYPTGRRVRLDYGDAESVEDSINRTTGLGQVDLSGTLQRQLGLYAYTGGGRKIAQEWGNRAVSSQLPRVRVDHRPNDKPSGLDRFGRIVDLVFLQGESTFPGNILHRYQYGYDATGNRLFEEVGQVSYGGPAEDHWNNDSYKYTYDSLNRLTLAGRGELSPDRQSITSTPQQGFAWKLDVLGNWSGGDPNNPDSYVENHTSVATHDEVDQKNQITARKRAGQPDVVMDYDPAGNIIDDGLHQFSYDAWGRLSAVYRKSDGATVGAYQYDPLGRRVWKKVYNSAGLNTTYGPDLFHYDGNRVIEQRVATDNSSGGGGPPGGGGPGGGGSPGGDCNQSETEVTNCNPPTAKFIEDSATRESTEKESRDGSVRSSSPVASAFDPLSPSEIEQVDLDAEVLGRSSSTIDLADLTPQDAKSTARASTITYNTRREFVWGLDYIDELIAIMWTGPLGDVYDHVLQDANYNIIAHAYANTNPATGVRHQFRYHPYGQWTYENAGGSETVTTNISSRLHATHGWQGLWFDQESGLVYVRGRYYDPLSGRFLSRDPNGQALTLTTALRSNAQTPAAFVSFWPREQYADSANPYLPCAANPNNRRDPSGLSSLDYFEEADELELDWYGQRLYTLGAINEGAKWASLGLELTLDIAGGLLGIDVFESVMVLASGRGGFWDSMNIVMAVAPFGHFGKAGGKLAKAFKTSRRSEQALDISRSAAKHLFKILPYKEAQKLTAGHRGAIQGHHLLEVRHLENWGKSVADAPAVILTAAEHNRITQEIYRKLPKSLPGVKRVYEPKDVWPVYKEVYSRLGYRDWLQHIEHYFQ